MNREPRHRSRTRPPASRRAGRRRSRRRAARALGHRVVVDADLHDALAAIFGDDDERLAAIGADGRRSAVELAIAAARRLRLVAAARPASISPTLAAAGQALDRAQRFHRLPARRAGARRHDDVRRSDGGLRFRRRRRRRRSRSTIAGACSATIATKSNARSTVRTSRARARCGAATWRMVAHLAGTPHLPRIDGGILFLEDVGEHPYRVERMLYQLHFAGMLARQRAVLLGDFNDYELRRRTTMATTRRRWSRTFARALRRAPSTRACRSATSPKS